MLFDRKPRRSDELARILDRSRTFSKTDPRQLGAQANLKSETVSPRRLEEFLKRCVHAPHVDQMMSPTAVVFKPTSTLWNQYPAWKLRPRRNRERFTFPMRVRYETLYRFCVTLVYFFLCRLSCTPRAHFTLRRLAQPHHVLVGQPLAGPRSPKQVE